MNLTPYQLALLAATLDGDFATRHPRVVVSAAISLLKAADEALKEQAEIRQNKSFGQVTG